MKYKHFFLLTVIFVFVALGISCSKPSEKSIHGKWQLINKQYRDSNDSTETEIYDGKVVVEFKMDTSSWKTACITYNGYPIDTCDWNIKDGTDSIVIKYTDGNREEYLIEEKEFSSYNMVWSKKDSTTTETEEGEEEKFKSEIIINWRKTK